MPKNELKVDKDDEEEFPADLLDENIDETIDKEADKQEEIKKQKENKKVQAIVQNADEQTATANYIMQKLAKIDELEARIQNIESMLFRLQQAR